MPTISTVRALILYAGLTRSRPRKTPAPIVISEKDMTTRLSRRTVKGAAYGKSLVECKRNDGIYRVCLLYTSFHTLSGDLTVNKCGDFYEMEFPAFKLKQIPVTQKIVEALGCMPKEAYLGRDLMCVFDDEAMIRKVNPDLDKVKELDGLLLHVTAQGKDCLLYTSRCV